MRRATVIILAFSASLAYGGDFCFNSTSPPNPAPPNNPDVLIVAQNFKPPKKGKCKAVVGFETASISSNPPTVPRPVTGTACLDAQGTILRAGFTLLEVYDSLVNNSSAIHHTIHVAMEIPYRRSPAGSAKSSSRTATISSARMRSPPRVISHFSSSQGSSNPPRLRERRSSERPTSAVLSDPSGDRTARVASAHCPCPDATRGSHLRASRRPMVASNRPGRTGRRRLFHGTSIARLRAHGAQG